MADEKLSASQEELAREYLGKLLERHRLGASENDIRSAFRDFLVRTAIADDESEIVTETRPAVDSRNKVDLYIRNTYVEFKRSIIKGVTPLTPKPSNNWTATFSRTRKRATAYRTAY